MQRAKASVFNCGFCSCDEETHDAGYPKWVIPEIDLTSSVCLRWLVNERSVYLIRCYNHYKQNILPSAGGWLDQSNVFITAVEVIENHLALSAARSK